MTGPLSYQELMRELDRIGADEALRSGLVAGPGITPEDVQAALRATPTGGGTAGFEATLDAIVGARRAREARGAGPTRGV